MKPLKKANSKSDADLLEQATDNLLRALKKEMIEKEGGVPREKLERDGYSPRLLDRLDEA
jgi:hypothetical protein